MEILPKGPRGGVSQQQQGGGEEEGIKTHLLAHHWRFYSPNFVRVCLHHLHVVVIVVSIIWMISTSLFNCLLVQLGGGEKITQPKFKRLLSQEIHIASPAAKV